MRSQGSGHDFRRRNAVDDLLGVRLKQKHQRNKPLFRVGKRSVNHRGMAFVKTVKIAKGDSRGFVEQNL